MSTEAITADDQQIGEEWKEGVVDAGDADEGHVTLADDEDGEQEPADGSPLARESRAQATNRWILEGRRWEVDRRRKDLIRQGVAIGLTRAAAADHAWLVVLAEFPPPNIQPSTLELPEPPPPEPEPVEEPQAYPRLTPEPPPTDPETPSGLGALPEHWPKLPANASLLAEVSWVLASRLDVAPAGSVVDLTKAETPPPSKAALAWLETSISFPAKFADVAVKATQHQEDEQGATRRERSAVDDIASLLDSTLEELDT